MPALPTTLSRSKVTVADPAMKYHFFLGFLAVVAARPGVIHDEAPQYEEKFDHQSPIGESAHHHHVEHEHAKSHQSIKFEHFHPVPVYVKKEFSHLLKHPLEKGKSEQELKQIHPEHHPIHAGGLVLEDHRFNTENFAAEHGFGHQGFEHGGLEHGGFEHGGYEQLGGGYEGSEGLKAYADESEGLGHYLEQMQHAGEGYKIESY